MRFIETSVFTRHVKKSLREEEYRALQRVLLYRPEQGALIPESGGLRKIRWGAGERGKRSSHRIIYYWDTLTSTFYMLMIYAKNQQEDLTREQLRILRRLVKEEFK